MARSLEKLSAQLGEEPEQLSYLRIKISYAAFSLVFACGGDHGMASRGELRTQVTESGRLGWTDGTDPPEINHVHHPDELLRGDPDPPEDEQ